MIMVMMEEDYNKANMGIWKKMAGSMPSCQSAYKVNEDWGTSIQ